ncbi:MAG TPA: GntR family transcriptional regulator [Thermomicrobiales bacterium]|nr:GntR family transcriptional regulator [Thermomicrobiales bacterium]
MEQPGTARTVVPAGQARSFEPIVDQFLQRIHDGQLRPGERLDTERELAAQFGVSRGVIREAIKVLVALGLVESRQGSGTYISSHQVPSISRSLILSARPEPESLAEMAEYRIPLERQGAELAAHRRTSDEAEQLMNLAAATGTAARADDWTEFGRNDRAFHLLIGKAARNSLLEATLAALGHVMQNAVSMVLDRSGQMEIAAAHHLAIAEAILLQDTALAGQRMEAHVRYSTDELLARMAAAAPGSGDTTWHPLTVSRLVSRVE